VMDEVKTVFGKFNAINAIQDRTRLVAELNAAVKASMLSADGVLEVETVQLENIDFSDVYEQAVEARMKAEVEVAKLRQNLEQERINAEITVTQANAKADSNLALAQSEAKAITVKGNAEADAINAKGKALRDNPALVALVSAEKWDGVLPTTMVPGNAVPFVNVN
jgi:regulator of protease activity HflC (stomatin/prohibitin superfamily)